MVTSDGYPEDELQACLKVGRHANLVQLLAQVNESGYLALIMSLIPAHYDNLGLPPSFDTCTRDIFPVGFTLTIAQIEHRALLHFIDDLISVCVDGDRNDEIFHILKKRVTQ